MIPTLHTIVGNVEIERVVCQLPDGSAVDRARWDVQRTIVTVDGATVVDDDSRMMVVSWTIRAAPTTLQCVRGVLDVVAASC